MMIFHTSGAAAIRRRVKVDICLWWLKCITSSATAEFPFCHFAFSCQVVLARREEHSAVWI